MGVLDLKAEREPVATKDAATLVLVRAGEGDAGLEVFCVERNKKSRFLGGAIVFPGGKVDAIDRDPAWRARSTTPRDVAAPDFAADGALLAFAVAALREALEEAALLPVHGGALSGDDVL